MWVTVYSLSAMGSEKKAAKLAKKAAKASRSPANPPAKAPPPAPGKVVRDKAAKPLPKAKEKPRPKAKRDRDLFDADPELFAPLAQGEIADALRVLSEDRRLTAMAKVGRFRVIATEPLVVKPPHWTAGHRLARIVVYDYSADRCVDACIDLDLSAVAHLNVTRAQPMLSREEEALAITVALADDRVKEKLTLGDEPQAAMQYWSRHEADLAANRRSAAVLFGRQGAHPSLVAVVDLVDSLVTDIVPASQW
jgi:Cu2+-containing amine oxidase